MYSLVNINIPEAKEKVDRETFTFSLNKDKLREVMRKEGRYLLRSNLTATDPELLWKQYMVLGEIEQAFKGEFENFQAWLNQELEKAEIISNL